jgi:hypothetical protein
MNTCRPWPTRYSTMLRLGQVHHVELVDHRRDDHQRDLPDRGGDRAVLDQLEHRGPQHHRPGRDREVHPDFERVRLDHGRHPRRTSHVGDEMPQARHGAAAAGVEGGLGRGGIQQRVIAGGQRVDQVGQREPDPFAISLVQAGVGHHALRALRGGQVGLHGTAQQRVARPGRVGEPAVPPGRLHLGPAHGDAGQLTGQPPPPRPATSRGLAARAAARRSPEPPGLNRRSMPVAASPSSRSSGVAAASSAADLVGSVSALIDS